MLDRSITPIAEKLNDKFQLPVPESKFLNNGIPFHSLLIGNPEALRIEFIFDGGNWNQTTPGASYFCTKLLSAGTANHTSKQIEDQLAQAGAFLDLESNNEKNTVTLYVLAKHIEALLPLVVEILTQPVFPEAEIDNLKKITRQNLAVNLNKTSYLASTNFKQAIYGTSHPYGRSMTDEVIDTVNYQGIINYFTETFAASRCVIILSGNGNLDFFSLINKYFGQTAWGNQQMREDLKHSYEYKPNHKNIVRPNAVQSSIRLGMPLFTISHPDYLDMVILIEILGGYFGSRLMKNIREDKGYTYGIHSSLVSMLHDGYMVIGTDVNGDNTEATLKEIFYEISRLCESEVGDEELGLVKNYLTGSFLNSLNTPFALADKFKSIYFNNLPVDFYSSYLQSIEAVTPRRLQKLAQTYLVKENFTQIVVGRKI